MSEPVYCEHCDTVSSEPCGCLPALIVPKPSAAQRLASAVANIAAIVDDPLIAGRLRGALHAFDEDSR